MKTIMYELSLTTQGPTYPPSEVMDEKGNFIVIGQINRMNSHGELTSEWGRALVSISTVTPEFVKNAPYDIIKELSDPLSSSDASLVLHTLPLPLPCNNYPVIFAPAQCPNAKNIYLPSYGFHEVPIPDARNQDGRKITAPITLEQWCKAKGSMEVSVPNDQRTGHFHFEFLGLIPNSLYTIMALRQHDLNPHAPTRPGPLGLPNILLADADGHAFYQAILPNPFPSVNDPSANRIVNIVLLWMSYQMNRGGAIGWYGLGGDVHAQLKLKKTGFWEFTTKD
ncbi:MULTISPECIES: hypothetical protein [unclassified Bartonella]|uniref:hypothetical protein n=1 Tax=unclassified Bartonella TaxID=2645622 RepID=UPI0035CF3F36